MPLPDACYFLSVLPICAIEWDGIDGNVPAHVHVGHLSEHQWSTAVWLAVSEQVNGVNLRLWERHLKIHTAKWTIDTCLSCL